MRVTYGWQHKCKGTVISFQMLKGEPAGSQPKGYAVVLADDEEHVCNGFSRFVLVPFNELKTDPPDRKWGLS